MFSTSRRAALTSKKPKAPSLPLKVPQIPHEWQGWRSHSFLKGTVGLLVANESHKWKMKPRRMLCIRPHHDNQARNAEHKVILVSVCKYVLGRKRLPCYREERLPSTLRVGIRPMFPRAVLPHFGLKKLKSRCIIMYHCHSFWCKKIYQFLLHVVPHLSWFSQLSICKAHLYTKKDNWNKKGIPHLLGSDTLPTVRNNKSCTQWLYRTKSKTKQYSSPYSKENRIPAFFHYKTKPSYKYTVPPKEQRLHNTFTH